MFLHVFALKLDSCMNTSIVDLSFNTQSAVMGIKEGNMLREWVQKFSEDVGFTVPCTSVHTPLLFVTLQPLVQSFFLI